MSLKVSKSEGARVQIHEEVEVFSTIITDNYPNLTHTYGW
jgi:hypothetical protein